LNASFLANFSKDMHYPLPPQHTRNLGRGNSSQAKGAIMKILLINQFFWPDSSAASQQLTDLAAGLAERGMDVTVLCGEGGYAGAAGSKPPAGVRILRAKALPFSRGSLGRILSYLSFYISAGVRALTAPRQDVILTLTTPPLISLLGTLLKLLRGSKHFVYEQDMYPDVAIDLKYLKANSPITRIIGFLADLPRRRSNGVIALGECMKTRLLARGIPSDQIVVVENWANSVAIQPLPRPGDPTELVLLYSGNFGLAHDMGTLTGAMQALTDDPRFRFLFVGSGGRRAELVSFCELNNIRSAEFRPYVPRDHLSQGLAAGDIGVVTQRADCCGTVVPSKVYGILAAGRPVLFIGPREATPALIIKRHDCGWIVEPGDVEGLAKLLLELARDPGGVQQAGARGRQALLDFYDMPQSIDRIASILAGDSVREFARLDPHSQKAPQLSTPHVHTPAADQTAGLHHPRSQSHA